MAFRRDGYVVVDLLSKSDVRQLRERFDQLYQGRRSDVCDRSNESRDLAYRERIHRLITDAVGPAVDAFLDDHRVVSTGTLVKWAGPNSQMPAHQDWTMVDEERHRSLSLWVPLCDVDPRNGALAVLPGSHQVLSGMRPNPGRPPSLPDPVAGVEPGDLCSIDLRAGQCLIFDHGVLHGSPPSQVSAPRTALVLAATPAAATLQHLWRRAEDDKIEQFEVVDPEFYRHCTPEFRPNHPAGHKVAEHTFRPHPDGATHWVHEQVHAIAEAGGPPRRRLVRIGRLRRR